MSLAPVAAGAPRELTVRAVLVGCGIGALLAAGNVYTSIKTGHSDGDSISAAVLGFSFFAVFRRLSRAPYSAAENNVTQTTAASAAVMSFVLGAGGPLSALAMMGKSYPGWQLMLWTICLGLLGIFIATLLRNKLIVVEDLPFPTGAATAEIIQTIHTTRESALYRARLLTFAALAAMYLAWFRDGPSALIAQSYVPAITVAGVTAASLSIGVSWSPLMASTGVLMGLRGAASMLVGAGLAWIVVAPRLIHGGLVPAEYSALVSWLVWPALGIMLPSTFLPLLLDWRATWRSFRDLSAVVRIRRPSDRSGEAPVPLQKTILLICLIMLVVLGRVTFGLHPLLTLAALLIAVALAGVCARAAGETDIAPVGQVGMAMQLGFGGSSTTSSLVAGGIAQGSASQVAQMMWAFKAGRRLGASPRAQVIAQVVGAVLGALVVVPVYLVIIQAYQLGSETMPAASAVSWKATAEAVHGGLATLPRHGPLAAVVGMAFGVTLTLLGRTRLQRFLPSPTALGIAVLMPASLTATIFLGASAAALVQKRWPQVNDTALSSVAAGGIAGESLMGVVIAILIAFGLI